jgi:hypothetical protein
MAWALAADQFRASPLLSLALSPKRLFDIDMQQGPNRGGGLKIIAATSSGR